MSCIDGFNIKVVMLGVVALVVFHRLGIRAKKVLQGWYGYSPDKRYLLLYIGDMHASYRAKDCEL